MKTDKSFNTLHLLVTLLFVYLALVYLVFHPQQEGPTVSFNAATTLHNFCVWQQSQNVQDDSHPSHHDTALLITRYTLIHLFMRAQLGLSPHKVVETWGLHLPLN